MDCKIIGLYTDCFLWHIYYFAIIHALSKTLVTHTNMNLFFWKKNQTIDIFASKIANDLFSAVQPQSIRDFFQGAAKDKNAKKSRKTVEVNLQNVTKQIQQFRVTNSLGTYGKARLQLKFNERLKELGYDSDIVSKLNEFILVKIP